MKCPLRNASIQYTDEEVGIDTWDCLKEGCAWWCEENNACALLTLAQGITYIHSELLMIEKRMPHKGQFLR